MSAAPARMNPFPGLRPFTQEEDYLFFGREEQTIELLQRLGKQPLRGGRGHLGQRQVVAGPLRTVVATAWAARCSRPAPRGRSPSRIPAAIRWRS